MQYKAGDKVKVIKEFTRGRNNEVIFRVGDILEIVNDNHSDSPHFGYEGEFITFLHSQGGINLQDGRHAFRAWHKEIEPHDNVKLCSCPTNQLILRGCTCGGL